MRNGQGANDTIIDEPSACSKHGKQQLPRPRLRRGRARSCCNLEATLRPEGAPRMMGRQGVVQNRTRGYYLWRINDIGKVIDWLVAGSYAHAPGIGN
jgi:hypothetical protein